MVFICDKPYNNESYQTYFDIFPYALSDFQKYAIEAIVNNQHVLVTAHTGSGKTLPAEFAIQHFASQGKKIIYTSPIKALSNQKYYEFTKKYPHISFGLLTGDIKINPSADVLIMTAEILMNYLFKNNDVKTTSSLQFQMDIDTELACVVMDEIHYINDAERGQVWEKTILMLPPQVQMIMLSATIDAPERFAQWCEDSHKNSDKQVFLASTYKRVVPLTHYSFLTTTEAIFKKIKDKTVQAQIRNTTNKLITLQTENGSFQPEGYIKISNMLKKVFEPNNLFMKRSHVLNNLTLFLKNNDMLPAIGFVFSRKNTESCAKEITTVLLEDDSKVPYIIKRECEQIIRKLPNFEEYLQLPEYNSLVSLLEKGIAYHHSGMLSILREIVELMISKKYVKLLFATESFAIGLDCPIRTAIFTSVEKFDGRNQRYLMSHEYTQMAGRSGRRGIDTIGHVVHCNNLFPIPTQQEYKTILGGKPQSLISKFRITFPLLLNLIKNGKTNNFHDFVEKSMIQNEMDNEVKNQKIYIESLIQDLDKNKLSVKYIRTPLDMCESYAQLIQSIPTLTNKKRKEAERSLESMIVEYKFIKDDSTSVIKWKESENNLYNNQQYLENIQTHVKQKIDKLCHILENRGFIIKDETDNYSLTYHLGKVAASIAEINSVVFSELMKKTHNFEKFSSKQLIGLFSCFTDIKIKEEVKLSVPNTEDILLMSNIIELKQIFKQYESLEDEYNLNSGFDYENALTYDIVDEVIKWCDCENEKDCKYFIFNSLGEKDIAIGDFSKAILKINTISKELMTICEQNDIIDLMHKLSKIDGMILKYITTTQSLYV